MNNIEIRRAVLEDLTDLYDLGFEFESYNKEKSTRPHEHFFGDWRKYFVDEIQESLTKRNFYVYIAFIDGVPAGYIESRLCKSCGEFIVEELFVRTQFSKLGIGGKLLGLAIKRGKKLEYDIKIEVFDWNTPALNYYLKKGFFVESFVLRLPESVGSI